MRLHSSRILHIVLLTLIVSLGVYIYTLAIPAGTISLAYKTSEDFHIVSVNAGGLRRPFFGTAFHLHYDIDALIYDHFTLGDYFTSSDSPLVLVNESLEKGTLMIGISLKRGELLDKPDGTLVNLYFEGRPKNDSTFTFSNTVFSTFDEEREDVSSIDFAQ
ncbi:hypothetical protein ACFL3C_04415 [Patescibacteria group bacterium]